MVTMMCIEDKGNSSQAPKDSTNAAILQRTAKYVRELQLQDASGHDWSHTLRVWNLSITIAVKENADIFITSLAALLHDVADWKLFDGDEEKGLGVVEEWLVSMNADSKVIKQVREIISQLSFMGGGTPRPMTSLEGQIVQDADRLDAIGAIGIGRCFAFGGAKGRMMHDPATSPRLDMSQKEYKKSRSSSINHFHEKLLLLRDKMNTPTAKQMAERRHVVMVDFLGTFESEWHEGNLYTFEDPFPAARLLQRDPGSL